jgi:hypothetical protein
MFIINIILRKCLRNFVKSEMPVCPDVFISPVFQVFIDDGRVSRSFLIVNICPALVKHSTPLPRI